MKYNGQLQPVSRYATPNYPTQTDVECMPNLLHALPARWGAKPAVCMALMLTLTSGLASCTRQPELGDASALTIPVFYHGEGRGAYGCDSVAPPVYLSEDEAQQAIRDEAEAYGIDFYAKRTIRSDSLPDTNLGNPYATEEDGTRSGTLELDGYDPRYNLGFEFVSQADLAEWSGTKSTFRAYFEFYDMKGTAELLAKAVPGTAMFYGPGADYSAYAEYREGNGPSQTLIGEDYIAFQKERMLEDLRLQVRDFLAWLAAEGVI